MLRVTFHGKEENSRLSVDRVSILGKGGTTVLRPYMIIVNKVEIFGIYRSLVGE